MMIEQKNTGWEQENIALDYRYMDTEVQEHWIGT